MRFCYYVVSRIGINFFLGYALKIGPCSSHWQVCICCITVIAFRRYSLCALFTRYKGRNFEIIIILYINIRNFTSFHMVQRFDSCEWNDISVSSNVTISKLNDEWSFYEVFLCCYVYLVRGDVGVVCVWGGGGEVVVWLGSHACMSHVTLSNSGGYSHDPELRTRGLEGDNEYYQNS